MVHYGMQTECEGIIRGDANAYKAKEKMQTDSFLEVLTELKLHLLKKRDCSKGVIT